MTRINDAPIARSRHALTRMLIVAGMMSAVAACGDYGPPTSNRIQSDIDSSAWINQLPQGQPDAVPGAVVPPVASPRDID